METTYVPIPIAESIAGGWRPGIGDPSVGGWLTVAAYLAAAVACWSASAAERRRGDRKEESHPIFWRREFDRHDSSPPRHRHRPPALPRADSRGRRVLFWRILAAGMLVLGINKQLDLQTLILVAGRGLAREQGWYEDRQAVQRAFIFAVAVVGIGALSAFAFLFRSAALRRPLAPIGVFALFAFVLVRASSFHHVDVLLGGALLGVRVNLLLELGGILLVSLSAIRCIAEARRGWEIREGA
ncbi:hypothetical protein [Tautonia plasticadhaerens]|uniref:hypothetical protein n=1 Tax=Tautonia plasticadhaerens TaxID=2527974 RepID=UPI0011AA1CC9|nr:hypothetical protein [Tautonia plasticadhaerens]